ncbi:hypothetical protein, partial [Siminovitchia terrae]|uniref:hypothetical protein n=1 Tax=Siminovitchia terrae TaxID=1914933 RepID=UPI0028ABC81F
ERSSIKSGRKYAKAHLIKWIFQQNIVIKRCVQERKNDKLDSLFIEGIKKLTWNKDFLINQNNQGVAHLDEQKGYSQHS